MLVVPALGLWEETSAWSEREQRRSALRNDGEPVGYAQAPHELLVRQCRQGE